MPEDNISNLHSVLNSAGLYTKSLDDFKSQYSDEESVGKLYDVVEQAGLASKGRDHFFDKYYPDLKKKDQSDSGGSISDSESGGLGPYIQRGATPETKTFRSPSSDDPALKEEKNFVAEWDGETPALGSEVTNHRFSGDGRFYNIKLVEQGISEDQEVLSEIDTRLRDIRYGINQIQRQSNGGEFSDMSDEEINAAILTGMEEYNSLIVERNSVVDEILHLQEVQYEIENPNLNPVGDFMGSFYNTVVPGIISAISTTLAAGDDAMRWEGSAEFIREGGRDVADFLRVYEDPNVEADVFDAMAKLSDDELSAEEFASSLSKTTGQLLGTTALIGTASAVNPGLGFTVAGTLSAEEMYREIEASGADLTRQEMAALSLLYAPVGAAMEYIPVANAMKRFGGNRALKRLIDEVGEDSAQEMMMSAQKSVRQRLMSASKEVGLGMLEEGVSESLTGLTQEGYKALYNALYGDEFYLKETQELFTDAAKDFALGAWGGLLFGGGGTVVRETSLGSEAHYKQLEKLYNSDDPTGFLKKQLDVKVTGGAISEKERDAAMIRAEGMLTIFEKINESELPDDYKTKLFNLVAKKEELKRKYEKTDEQVAESMQQSIDKVESDIAKLMDLYNEANGKKEESGPGSTQDQVSEAADEAEAGDNESKVEPGEDTGEGEQGEGYSEGPGVKESEEESGDVVQEELVDPFESPEDVSDIVEDGQKVRIGDTDVIYRDSENEIYLESIRTDEEKRGQGSASAAVDEVLKKADAEGKSVRLKVVTEGENVDERQLTEFYESKGFVAEGDEMVRSVVSESPVTGGDVISSVRERTKDVVLERAEPSEDGSPGAVLSPTGESSKLYEDYRSIFENEADAESFYKLTRTPEFNEWYGDSVRDSKGDPVVVYHGSRALFQELSGKKKGLSTNRSDAVHAFYFSSNPDVGKMFVDAFKHDSKGGYLYPSFVKIENPYKGKESVSEFFFGSERKTDLVKEKAKTHDGMILEVDPKKMLVVPEKNRSFDPSKSKGATGFAVSTDGPQPVVVNDSGEKIVPDEVLKIGDKTVEIPEHMVPDTSEPYILTVTSDNIEVVSLQGSDGMDVREKVYTPEGGTGFDPNDMNVTTVGEQSHWTEFNINAMADGLNEYLIFDPSQVKSVFNSGNFDSSSANMFDGDSVPEDLLKVDKQQNSDEQKKEKGSNAGQDTGGGEGSDTKGRKGSSKNDGKKKGRRVSFQFLGDTYVGEAFQEDGLSKVRGDDGTVYVVGDKPGNATNVQSSSKGATRRVRRDQRNRSMSRRVMADALVRRVRKAFPGIDVIVDEEAWAQATGGSDALGTLMHGRVYLNPGKFDQNTVLEEFGHLWIEMAKHVNTSVYNAGIKLVDGSSYHDAVLNDPDYVDLSELEAKEEALAKAIAASGEDMAARSRFKQWLSRFWAKIRSMLGLNPSRNLQEMTLGQYLTQVNKELMNELPLTDVTSDALSSVLDGDSFKLLDVNNSIIGGRGSGLFQKASETAVKWFTVDSGAGKEVSERFKLAKGAISSYGHQMKLDVVRLKKAVKSHVKEAKPEDRKSYVVELYKDLNHFMVDESVTSQHIHDAYGEAIANIASHMRLHVTNLSNKLMSDGVVTDEKIVAIFNENLNVYLHRSYRKHDVANWKETFKDFMGVEAYNAARSYVAKQYSSTRIKGVKLERIPNKGVHVRFVNDSGLDSAPYFLNFDFKQVNAISRNYEKMSYEDLMEAYDKTRGLESQGYDQDAIITEIRRREANALLDFDLVEDSIYKADKFLSDDEVFLDKELIREFKEIAEKYLDPSTLSEQELIDDLSSGHTDEVNSDFLIALRFREAAYELMKRGKSKQELFELHLAGLGWGDSSENAGYKKDFDKVLKYMTTVGGIQLNPVGYLRNALVYKSVSELEGTLKSMFSERVWPEIEEAFHRLSQMDANYAETSDKPGHSWSYRDFSQKSREQGHFLFVPSEEQVNAIINEIVDPESGFSESAYLGHKIDIRGVGRLETSVLMKRGDLDPVVRKLMGEYEEVGVNYTKSVLKMSRLLELSKMEMDFKNEGEGIFLSKGKPTKYATKKIKKTDSVNLGGYYTTPEIYDALYSKDVYDHGPVIELFYMLNGMTKAALTIFKDDSQARNFWGAMWMMTEAGVNPFTGLMDAAKVATSDFEKKHHIASVISTPLFVVNMLSQKLSSLTQEQADALYKDALRYGVMDQQLDTGVIQDIYSHINPGEANVWGKLKKGYRDTTELFAKPYQTSDNIFKVLQFSKEVDQLKKAYPNESEHDIKLRAADIVRRLQPTYSESTKASRWLSRNIFLGTFVMFAAQRIRNKINVLNQIKSEVKEGLDTDNTVLLGIASRRAAGFIVANTITLALAKAFMMFNDWDDEDDEAVSRAQPSYSENNVRLYLSPDKKKPEYLDLTFIDPNSTFQKTAIAYMRGETSYEGLEAAVGKFVDPFVGQEIFLERFLQALNNRDDFGQEIYHESDSDQEKVARATLHTAEVLVPGIVNSALNIGKGAIGYETDYGKVYDVLKEISNSRLGVKVKERDALVSLGSRSSFHYSLMNDARKKYADRLGGKGDLIDKTQSEVSAYREADKKAKHWYEELVENVRAARQLGFTDDEIYSELNGRRRIPQYLSWMIIDSDPYPGIDKDSGRFLHYAQ